MDVLCLRQSPTTTNTTAVVVDAKTHPTSVLPVRERLEYSSKFNNTKHSPMDMATTCVLEKNVFSLSSSVSTFLPKYIYIYRLINVYNRELFPKVTLKTVFVNLKQTAG